MPQTMTQCLDSRSARQVAALRRCRVLLAIGLGGLICGTIQATLPAFAPSLEYAQTCPARHQDPEVPEVAVNAVAQPDASASAQRSDVTAARPTEELRPEASGGQHFRAATEQVQRQLGQVSRRIAAGSAETWEKLSAQAAAGLAFLQRSNREAPAQGRDAARGQVSSPTPPAEASDAVASPETVPPAAASPKAASPEEASPASAPPEAASPTTTSPEVPAPTGLVLLNPKETGGTVSYVLDGQVHSLRAGEKHELASGLSWRIQFDRGEQFGTAEHTLTSGTYAFRVTERGWELSPTSQP